MITHYDMLTGETIVDDLSDEREDHQTSMRPEARLQLLGVTESKLGERYIAPAGVLMIPADRLIDA